MADDSRLSEDDWERWISPFQAVQMLREAGLDTREIAVNWIRARLRSGELRAAGWRFRFKDDGKLKDSYVGIYSAAAWANVDLVPATDDFWVSGDYQPDTATMWAKAQDELGFYDGTKDVPDRIFGHSLARVHFESALIEKFCSQSSLPVKQAGPPERANHSVRRGPKRKDWWDHLWIEMIRRIDTGTLKPSSQADLQRILEDFASHKLNVEPGDSTLKPMAANLFKYLQERPGEIGEN